MFTHRQLLFQILLVDPPKGAQKIASGSPQPLDRVGRHFPHAIAVVISFPFLPAVTDREVGALDPIVTLPLIGVTSRQRLRIALHILSQCLAVGAGKLTIMDIASNKQLTHEVATNANIMCEKTKCELSDIQAGALVAVTVDQAGDKSLITKNEVKKAGGPS